MNDDKYKTSSTYVDITSDPGFKIIFGNEKYKDVLISFLNAVITRGGNDPIVEITYLDKEKTKEDEPERSVRFDIFCETSCGKRFIVEMQRAKQNFFIKRNIFYAARAVTQQGRSGKYDYSFMPIYTISIMNFTDEALGNEPVVDTGICRLDTGKLLTNAMCWTYIQLPNLKKESADECISEIDKWIFVLKNMKIMKNMPFMIDQAFRRLDEVGRIENLSASERNRYEAELKYYRDYENTLSYAHDEGFSEGLKEGRMAGILAERDYIIKSLLSSGMPPQEIATMLRYPIEEIMRISLN